MEPKNKQGGQLDMLLLKAESYSNFILENQKRTKDVLESQKSSLEKVKKRKSSDCANLISEKNHIFEQPPNLIGGTLLPYQREGLQWLLSLWE